MKKKLLGSLLCVILCICFIFALTACNDPNPTPSVDPLIGIWIGYKEENLGFQYYVDASEFISSNNEKKILFTIYRAEIVNENELLIKHSTDMVTYNNDGKQNPLFLDILTFSGVNTRMCHISIAKDEFSMSGQYIEDDLHFKRDSMQLYEWKLRAFEKDKDGNYLRDSKGNLVPYYFPQSYL